MDTHAHTAVDVGDYARDKSLAINSREKAKRVGRLLSSSHLDGRPQIGCE